MLEISDVDHAVRSALTWLVGTSAAKQVLCSTGMAGLLHMTAAEIAASSHISPHIAERIVALRYLGTLFVHESKRPITCHAKVIEALPALVRSADYEMVIAIALDARLAPKAVVCVAQGGVTQATLHARDVFRPMLRLGAVSVILVHNHPSGDAEPSEDDLRLTAVVAGIGEVLGLPLLDHLIVAGPNITSFHDRGMMPSRRRRHEAVLSLLSIEEGHARRTR